MTLPTVEHSPLGEWQVDALRVRWDRLRTWDDEHQLVSDAATAAALLIVCLAVRRRFGLQLPEYVAFQVALIAPLVWRRRHPVAVFSIISLVAFIQWLVAVPLPADVALLIALFTLAVHARPKHALYGAGILMVGVVMASVRWGPAGDLIKSLVFLTGLVVAALFTGIALRTWRSYMDSLLERTRQLEFERDQQAQLAAASERARIAREMHDVVAHNVSIMVTLAEGAVASAESHPDRAREAMAEVSTTGRLALTDMRHLLGVLRTDDRSIEREPQPQLSGLPQLIRGVEATGLAVDFQNLGAPFVMPPGMELTIYRVIQESLTNVLKHSPGATIVRVEISFDAPHVDVLVRDDGGRSRPSIDGHGIDGMRERVATSGGALAAGPHPDGGWEVLVRMRVDQ